MFRTKFDSLVRYIITYATCFFMSYWVFPFRLMENNEWSSVFLQNSIFVWLSFFWSSDLSIQAVRPLRTHNFFFFQVEETIILHQGLLLPAASVLRYFLWALSVRNQRLTCFVSLLSGITVLHYLISENGFLMCFSVL